MKERMLRAMDARITGFAGVIVWTSSDRFDEMATFYRDVLELTPRSQRPGFINFEWAETRLTVAVHSDIIGRAPPLVEGLARNLSVRLSGTARNRQHRPRGDCIDVDSRR